MNGMEITAIEPRVNAAHEEAVTIRITDQITLNVANKKSLVLKALIKEIDDTFKPIHAAQKAAADETKAKWDKYRIPLDTDFRRIKADIGAFLGEEARKAEEARKKVWLAEQEKIKAEAERKRIEEEALRKAQEELTKGNQEKAEKIIERAAVKEEKLTAKIEEAITIIAIPVPSKSETVGFSGRTDWDIEIIDANAVPREYLMVDDVKIRKVIRATKGTIQIPGVRNVEKRIYSQR